MSWGERSCLKPCRCPEKCQPHSCNVDCKEYTWDQKTKPDSTKNGNTAHNFGDCRVVLRRKDKKKYKNYYKNQELRRANPGIKKIRDGVVVV